MRTIGYCINKYYYNQNVLITSYVLKITNMLDLCSGNNQELNSFGGARHNFFQHMSGFHVSLKILCSVTLKKCLKY